MSIEEVRIPDVGDAQDVDVVEIPAQPGSTVERDDTLVVLESDKASMDVPSPVAGVLESIEVAIGDKVTATFRPFAGRLVPYFEKSKP